VGLKVILWGGMILNLRLGRYATDRLTNHGVTSGLFPQFFFERAKYSKIVSCFLRTDVTQTLPREFPCSLWSTLPRVSLTQYCSSLDWSSRRFGELGFSERIGLIWGRRRINGIRRFTPSDDGSVVSVVGCRMYVGCRLTGEIANRELRQTKVHS
jgi:hypothetical protein